MSYKEESMEQKRVEGKVTVVVYEIHYTEQNINNPNIGQNLFNCLNSYSTIRDRLMPLSKDNDNTDSDFVASFSFSSNFLFGSLARLTVGEESHVSKSILDQKTVSLNDMIQESNDTSEGSIRKSSFFCVYKNLLVLTNKQYTQKALENYINWMLDNYNPQNKHIKFIPKKNTATSIPIKEIKSIQFQEGFINGMSDMKTRTMDITSKLLRPLLDVKGPQDFDEENLVSAILILKFKQKEINKEKALDAAFRIVDDESIIVTGKNGKKFHGSQFLISKTMKIEKLTTGIFNEKEIETFMRDVLKSVENGELVS